MTQKISYFAIEATLLVIIFLLPIVHSQGDEAIPPEGDEVIPPDGSQINDWFSRNVGPLSSRQNTCDLNLVAAEANVTVIKITADGKGDFKTIQEAVVSIPEGNKNRVIISIGPGNYTERIKIGRYQPFVTLYGDPKDMPTLVDDGTAAEFGTMDSATMAVEGEYFMGVNLKIVNSAPRPDGKRTGAQAVALRVSADKAAFHNCRMHGYQDTLCDDDGKHLYKDCYVEGTVDFIFGSGRSLFLNTEINVIPGDAMAMITAHARTKFDEPNGYVFVHCKVTGTGQNAYLGRAWMSHARVIYAYSELSDVVNPVGWSDNLRPANDETVFFGEYNNKGPGAVGARARFVKQLSEEQVKPFLSLSYIKGSKWLLPPPVF